MKRSEIRKEVLKYLENFLSKIVLYKEFPAKQKMRIESLAKDLYEQLGDEERQEIYFRIKN